jgi:hypothetical protein
MGPVITRELDVMARRTPFVAAVIVHAGLLGLFVLGWGDGRGVPLLPDLSFYEQTRLVQAGLLALLLPWTAARCAAPERGNELVLLSALTGFAPSRLIAARACAGLAGLVLIVASGLPIALMTQRMSAVDTSRLIRDEAVLMAIAMMAWACVLWSRHLTARALRGWLGAAVLTVAVMAAAGLAVSSAVLAAGVLAAIGGAAVLLLLARADVSLRYLAEQDA